MYVECSFCLDPPIPGAGFPNQFQHSFPRKLAETQNPFQDSPSSRIDPRGETHLLFQIGKKIKAKKFLDRRSSLIFLNRIRVHSS